jgi:hypothetical protein
MIQEMQKKLELREETYFMAVNMMDRYRAQGGKGDGERVLIACVRLASKYEEIYVKETELMIELVSAEITDKEIRDLELEVLHRLDFSVKQCCHLTLIERMKLLFQLDQYFSHFCIYLLKVMQINSGLAFANQAYLTVAVGVRVAERCYNLPDSLRRIESLGISPQLLKPIYLKAESALKSLLNKQGCFMRQLLVAKLGGYLVSSMEKKFTC